MKTLSNLCFCILVWTGANSGFAADTNIMCPVLQDREATDDYVVDHKGAEVRFCCSECVLEFQKNPEIYENVIPQLQNLPLRTQVSNFMGDYGGIVIGSVLVCMLIGLRIYRSCQPASAKNTGLLNKRISPVFPLLVLAGYLGSEVYGLQEQLHETQLEDEIHFATFYDFGYPPVPRRPATEPRLTGSYYRGNDERSPKLFNNGNYRTATFNISLVNEHGHSVAANDNIANACLFVKFEIERPPFTPDFLYTEDMMRTMFLTAQCDRFLGSDGPVADRVELDMVEPMQRWEALFPINSVGMCCSNEAKGTVYVCERYYYQPQISLLDKRRGGSRFHYGIRYDLKVKDGILLDDSDMYMGALYRTRKLPTWRVPMTEWFSHKPIPELPGQNVDAPDLLGIDDHLLKKSLLSGDSLY